MAARTHRPASRTRQLAAAVLLAAAAGTVALYAPVLGLGLAGDELPWWYHAHRARLDPALLVRPFSGVRLLATWLLAAEDGVWGTWVPGYRITSLALLVGCGLLLAAALRREGAPPAAAAAAAAVFWTSPLVFEPAVLLADRPDLVLAAGWLALALVWPRPGPFPRRRLAGVAAIAATTALAKESWVVLPGFVAVLEALCRRVPARVVLRSAALAGVPALAYTALYLARPAISPDTYYTGGVTAAAKLPHVWAATLGLVRLQPAAWRIGPGEAAAAAMVAAAAWAAWRWRLAGVGHGLALMTLPLLPLLPVPALTTRYTAAPWAGAVLAGTAGAVALARAAGRRRRAVWAAATLVAVLAVVRGAAGVRLEVDDLRRWVAPHLRLTGEARLVVPSLPPVPRLVAVRLERDEPLRRLRGTERGLRKAYYVRPAAPYGLVEWPELLTYADAGRGNRIWVAEDVVRRDRVPFAVLVHRRGRFDLLRPSQPTAADEAALWSSRGVPVRVLRIWRP